MPSKGVGLGSLLVWFNTALIGFLFPVVRDVTNIGNIFFFFSFCCLAGFIYVHLRVKETKGLSFVSAGKYYNGELSDKEVQNIIMN